MPDGRTLRTFEIVAEDKEIEIAPGIIFPAWTYNGRVPGPTLRATEGERLRIVFRNYGSHPHSMHFHGIHAARMDGVPGAGLVDPGEEFVYEFDAKPVRLPPLSLPRAAAEAAHAQGHVRRLHRSTPIRPAIPSMPPSPARACSARRRMREWQELVMVMNAFDTNFDGENEVYAVNTVAQPT